MKLIGVDKESEDNAVSRLRHRARKHCLRLKNQPQLRTKLPLLDGMPQQENLDDEIPF